MWLPLLQGTRGADSGTDLQGAKQRQYSSLDTVGLGAAVAGGPRIMARAFRPAGAESGQESGKDRGKIVKYGAA